MNAVVVHLDAEGARARLLPSLEWALNNGLLDDGDAARLLIDEIISTLEVLDGSE